MQATPAPEKKPEVVYRKRTTPKFRRAPFVASEIDRRAFVLAIAPLIIGFLLLLVVIFVLGWLSANKMEEVGLAARIKSASQLSNFSLLLDLRLKANQLYSEARIRHTVESRGVAPPFDVKLNTARSELRTTMRPLEQPPLSENQDWTKLRANLQEFIRVTEDSRRFSLEGFEKFLPVNEQLGVLFNRVQEQQQIAVDELLNQQKEARQTINFWTVIALVVGALVAAATFWQVQRHFWQMRRSMVETQRERTFTTQLLEGMVSAVAAIDAEDRIRSANAAFFHIFPKASIGASVLERFAPDDAMNVLETVTSIRVQKATYHGRFVVKLEGEDKAFDVYSSPLAIDGERGQIVTLVDATEVAETERTLRRSESLAAVGQATTQVAHEIRNPLGSIRLGVSMLRDSVSDQEALNTIELVERGIKHLNKLVVDVTQFSRQKELERSAVDLHESLERSIDLVSERIQEKNARVEKSFVPTPIVGQWDADQLRQVFVNVIANAIDASQENAPVWISTELLNVETDGDGSRKHYARITIADEGKGMDKTTRERIFEPFYSTKKRGTGLGLAIVKQIVEQHGGKISVASEPGQGSKFRIDLPV